MYTYRTRSSCLRARKESIIMYSTNDDNNMILYYSFLRERTRYNTRTYVVNFYDPVARSVSIILIITVRTGDHLTHYVQLIRTRGLLVITPIHCSINYNILYMLINEYKYTYISFYMPTTSRIHNMFVQARAVERGV